MDSRCRAGQGGGGYRDVLAGEDRGLLVVACVDDRSGEGPEFTCRLEKVRVGADALSHGSVDSQSSETGWEGIDGVGKAGSNQIGQGAREGVVHCRSDDVVAASAVVEFCKPGSTVIHSLGELKLADNRCQVDLFRALVQQVDDLLGFGFVFRGAIDNHAVCAGIGNDAGGSDGCGLRGALPSDFGQAIRGIGNSTAA